MKNFSLRKIGYFFVTIILIIVLHYFGALSPAERILERGFNPFVSGFHAFGIKIRDFYNRQTSGVDLEKENEAYQSQIEQLTVEVARLRTLEDENKSLREQLDFRNKENRQLMLVNISSRALAGDANQTITLDRGSVDGLSVGLPVVSGAGLLIGKIVETKEHLSLACLVTSSRCQFAASVENQNRTVGLTKGELGLTIKMDFIPQTEVINQNDLVMTSGLEQNVPRGLVLGRISQVQKLNKELWQTATIEPLVNLNDLVIASVILP
jgi:rod shape-determining protein MreC